MSASSIQASAAENDDLLTQIVDAVSTAEQCEATDLPPLYETIDYEMVERMVEGSDGVEVAFQYLDYTVTVDSDGRVEVTPTEE